MNASLYLLSDQSKCTIAIVLFYSSPVIQYDCVSGRIKEAKTACEKSICRRGTASTANRYSVSGSRKLAESYLFTSSLHLFCWKLVLQEEWTRKHFLFVFLICMIRSPQNKSGSRPHTNISHPNSLKLTVESRWKSKLATLLIFIHKNCRAKPKTKLAHTY